MKKVLVLSIALAGLLAAADLGPAIQLYNSGKYAEAEKALRKATTDEPGNAQAHYYLGMTLLRRADTAGASQELQKADELQPGNAETQLGLAQLYVRQNDTAKAEAALNKGVELSPGNPQIPFVRGQISLAKKDYAGAIAELEKAVAADPNNAYAHYYLALAYNGAKKPDKMVEHLDAFLKLAPDAPEAARANSIMRTVR